MMTCAVCFGTYLMMFWQSWRCSRAFLTSMSFNRARVPIVRWSFAGFWKMLSSTPWSCTSSDFSVQSAHFYQSEAAPAAVVHLYIIYISSLLHYLGTLPQDVVFESEESLLDFGIIQRKREEMCERLLLPVTVNEHLDTCNCRWDCGFVGTCDNW